MQTTATKTTIKTLALALALYTPLACQGTEATTKKPKSACEVTLVCDQDIAVEGTEVTLVLKIEAHEDVSVDATLLSGYVLLTKIDGKDGPKLGRAVSGKVKLAAGTRIERKITISVADVFKGKIKSLRRVTFTWPRLIGVGTTISVAPSMNDINVADLDLAKTKVTLVTNFGKIKLKFRPDKAPNTVRNFVKLVKEGFYNGTKFHRVMPEFMIQGGCPNTKEGATGQPGSGDPGYSIKAEFNDLRHVRGVISMARSADKDSAGCQFFLMCKDNRGLDGQYTAFGEMESGFDTMDKIRQIPLGTRGNEKSVPLKPVHLQVAIVHPVFKKKKQ